MGPRGLCSSLNMVRVLNSNRGGLSRTKTCLQGRVEKPSHVVELVEKEERQCSVRPRDDGGCERINDDGGISSSRSNGREIESNGLECGKGTSAWTDHG